MSDTKSPGDSASDSSGDFPEARDLDAVEQAMHELAYGVYVIGSVGDGAGGERTPSGMIADWVMQVSFQPRLLAVSFENDSTSLARIRKNKIFTVNILTGDLDGMDLARGFLQPYLGSKVRGRSVEEAARTHDKLANVAYRTTESGCPVLEEALAWIECEAQEFVSSGDHTLVIGNVIDGDVEGEGEPLTSTFTGWTYSG